MNPTLPLSEPTETVIPSGSDTSGNLNAGGRVPSALVMPAAWTAADITFEVSIDGSTWVPVHLADGTQYTLTVAASRFVSLTADYFIGAKHVRLVSSVNQGADRTMTLMMSRPVTR